MTKHNSIILILGILVVAFAYSSCNKEDNAARKPCLEPRKYFLYMQTVNAADTGTAGIAYNLPAPFIGYVDTNLAFYNGTVVGSDFRGPLSGIADSTRWFIMPDTSRPLEVDTVTFRYERKPLFLSTACGYSIVYSLRSISSTNNLIDSTRIEETEVTNLSEIVHVKVFYN